MENIRAILGSLEILEETESLETKYASAENIRRHARVLMNKLQKIEADRAFLLREVERLEEALSRVASASVVDFIKNSSNIKSISDADL